MQGRLEGAWTTVRAVVYEIRREDVTFMAASIAYHAFLSLLPILLLLTVVVSAVGSDRLVTSVLELTTTILPDAGQGAVVTALRNASGSVATSLIGVVVLLWGTVKIFRAMDAAFSEIYDTERTVTVLDQFVDAVVVLLAMLVAATAVILVGPVLRLPPELPFAGAVNALVAIAGLAVAFLPLYYVFPDMAVGAREVVPGALVAAVGWRLLEWIFHLYASVSSKPDVYGLVGTLLLLLTWLYVGSLVLLVGAAVNSTLAGRSGDRRAGGKRRFGRQVTDADSLDGRVGDLVGRAREAEVPGDEIRRILERHAASVEAGDRERPPEESR